jgi:GPH family glycoside/pentoside/hexuronide:cation symporter
MGAIAFAIAYWLMWQVPPISGLLLSFYYLGVLLILNLAHSCVAVPYSAVTPELTDDYDERTALTTIRYIKKRVVIL